MNKRNLLLLTKLMCIAICSMIIVPFVNSITLKADVYSVGDISNDAIVVVNGNNNYADMQTAINNINDANSIITLNTNITIEEEIVINKCINLDLNGCSIVADFDNGCLFNINEDAELNIYDSKGTGKISSKTLNSLITNNGTLNLFGGAFAVNSINAYSIVLSKNSITNIYYAEILGNAGININSCNSLNIYNAIITTENECINYQATSLDINSDVSIFGGNITSINSDAIVIKNTSNQQVNFTVDQKNDDICISGNNALNIKNAKVCIFNGSFLATNGNAIIYSGNAGWIVEESLDPIDMHIYGGNFTSSNNSAINLLSDDYYYDLTKVYFYGGNYDGLDYAVESENVGVYNYFYGGRYSSINSGVPVNSLGNNNVYGGLFTEKIETDTLGSGFQNVVVGETNYAYMYFDESVFYYNPQSWIADGYVAIITSYLQEQNGIILYKYQIQEGFGDYTPQEINNIVVINNNSSYCDILGVNNLKLDSISSNSALQFMLDFKDGVRVEQNKEVVITVSLVSDASVSYTVLPNVNGVYTVKQAITEDIVIDVLNISDLYNVSFVVDGNILDIKQVKYNNLIEDEITPLKTGYTFDYWYNLNDDTMQAIDLNLLQIIEDTVLVAKFNVNNYNVNYYVDNEFYFSAKADYLSLISLTQPQSPTKTGYTFVGWSLEENGSIVDLTKVNMQTNDIKLYAIFEINEYDINFYSADGQTLLARTKALYNTKWNDVNIPVLEIDHFAYWSLEIGGSGLKIDDNFKIEETVNVYVVNVYTITFISNNYLKSQQVIKNSFATLPTELPLKDGYKCVGFSTSENADTPINLQEYKITEDLILYAVFEFEKYNVVFKDYNGSSLGDDYNFYLDYTSAIYLPTKNPTRRGYDFVGWVKTQDSTDVITNGEEFVNIGGNIYYAYYIKTTCSVYFYYNNGSEFVNYETIYMKESGTLYVQPPVKEGYTFVGWVLDGIGYIQLDQNTLITPSGVIQQIDELENLDLTQLYKFVKISNNSILNNSGIIFTLGETKDEQGNILNSSGEIINNGYLENADGTIYLKQNSSAGVLLQAEEVGEIYNLSNYQIGNDLALRAVFKINSYKTYFYNKDGSLYQVDTNIYNSYIVPPQNPSLSGYTFIGWARSLDGEVINADLLGRQQAYDMSFYAKYELLKFNVVFKVDQTIIFNQTINYGGTIVNVLNPSKEGYSFVGWYLQDDQSQAIVENIFSTAVITDVVYIAKFEPNSYTVTFLDYNGESLIGDYVFDILYGENVTTPTTTPQRVGYTFVGWSDEISGEVISDLGVMPANNISYYAIYEINKYAVTFYDEDAITVVAQIQNVLYGTTFNDVLKLINKTPTKTGYSFASWINLNETEIKSTFLITSNFSVKAKYLINSYAVNFYNGDSLIYSESVQYNNYAIAPEDLTAIGKTFVGWALQSDKNTAVNVPKIQIVSDTNFYAIFNDVYFTVCFYNGNIKLKEQHVAYANYVDTLNAPDKIGYNFVGWALSDSDSLLAEFPYQVKQNTNFYAKYNLVNFSVNVTENDAVDVVETNGNSLVKFANIENDLKFKLQLKNGFYQTDELVVSYSIGENLNVTIVAVNEIYTIPANAITDNIYISVEGISNLYEVKFVVDGENYQDPINVEYGKTITDLPANPVKAGYIFKSWTINGVSVSPLETKIYKNTTFTATFSLVNFSVNNAITNAYEIIDANNNTTNLFVNIETDFVFTYKLINGYRASVDKAPIVMYKIGDGFLKSANLVDGKYTIPKEDILGNIVIEIQNITNIYTVTFKVNNPDTNVVETIGTSNVVYGECLQESQIVTPNILGYKFVNYKLDDNIVDLQNYVIFGDVNVFATITKNIYTINYYDGETLVYSTSGLYKELLPISPVTPSKIGNIFVGWNSNKNASEAQDLQNVIVTKNLDYYAIYSPRKLSVIFRDEANNQIGNVLTNVHYGTTLGSLYEQDLIPNIEYAIGKEFYGWSTESGNKDLVVLDNYTIINDVTLYLLTKDIVYTVTSLEPTKYLITASIATYVNDFTFNLEILEGLRLQDGFIVSYSLDGEEYINLSQNANGSFTIPKNTINSDVVIKVEGVTNKFYVRFYHDDQIYFVGGLPCEYEIEYGKTLGANYPDVTPTKQGYKFIAWIDEFGKSVELGSVVVKSDLNFYSSFEEYHLSLTYYIKNNVATFNDTRYNKDNAILITNAQSKYYGYYKITSDEAVLTNGMAYSFSYDLQSGYYTKSVKLGTTNLEPDASGYYTIAASLVSQDVIIVIDVSNIYTITFKECNDKYSSSTYLLKAEFLYGQTFNYVLQVNTEIPYDAQTGYELAGWSFSNGGNGDLISDNFVLTGDVTVFAVYRKIPKYSIIVTGGINVELNGEQLTSITKHNELSFNISVMQGYYLPDGTEVIISCKDINGNNIELINNEVGSYTISQGVIESDITISAVGYLPNDYLIGFMYNFDQEWMMLFELSAQHGTLWNTVNNEFLNYAAEDSEYIPVEEGKVFVGWAVDGVLLSDDYVITSDFVVYPYFIEEDKALIVPSNNNFEIVSTTDPELKIESALKNTDFNFKIQLVYGYRVVPGSQMIVSYSTDGVNKVAISAVNGVYTISASIITTDITIYVEEITNKFYVYFYNYNDTLMESPIKIIKEVDYLTTLEDIIIGASIPYTERLDDGYTFAGWSLSSGGSGELIDLSTTVINDICLFASYTQSETILVTGNNGYNIVDINNNLITQSLSGASLSFKIIIDSTNGYRVIEEDIGVTYLVAGKSGNLVADENGVYVLPSGIAIDNLSILVNGLSNKYSLKFMVDDVVYREFMYEYNEQILKPVNPNKENYNFVEWLNPEGVAISFDDDNIMPMQNLTYTAKFEPKKYQVKSASDNYEIIGSTEIQYGTTANVKIKLKNGYRFTETVINGYYGPSNYIKYSTTYNIQESDPEGLNDYIVFEILGEHIKNDIYILIDELCISNNYEICFYFGLPTLVDGVYEYEASISSLFEYSLCGESILDFIQVYIADMAVENYTLTAWSSSNTDLSLIVEDWKAVAINDNLNFYAVYDLNRFIVNLVYGRTEIKSSRELVVYNGSLDISQIPVNAQETGYTISWQTVDGTLIEDILTYKITSDVTIIATYTPIKVNVTFVYKQLAEDGYSLTEELHLIQEFDYNSIIKLPEVLLISGYKVSWSKFVIDEYISVDINSLIITEDLVLYASYTPVVFNIIPASNLYKISISQFTFGSNVTFDLSFNNGYYAIQPLVVKYIVDDVEYTALISTQDIGTTLTSVTLNPALVCGDVIVVVDETTILNTYKITFNYGENYEQKLEKQLIFGSTGNSILLSAPKNNDVSLIGRTFVGFAKAAYATQADVITDWNEEVVNQNINYYAVYVSKTYSINNLNTEMFSLQTGDNPTYGADLDVLIEFVNGYKISNIQDMLVVVTIGNKKIEYDYQDLVEDAEYPNGVLFTISGLDIIDDITVDVISGATNKYVVSYYYGVGNLQSTIANIKYNSSIKELLQNAPTLANNNPGKTLVGWSIENDNTVDDLSLVKITNDISIYACYTSNSYKLYISNIDAGKYTFADDSMVQLITNGVDFNINIKLVNGYYKVLDYAFYCAIGNNDIYIENGILDGDEITNDVVLQIDDDCISNLYNVTFSYCGNEECYNFSYNTLLNDIIKVAPSIDMPGKTFIGWSLNNDNTVDDFTDKKLTIATTLYACYINNSYTVTIDSGDQNKYTFNNKEFSYKESATNGEDFVININLINGYKKVSDYVFTYTINGEEQTTTNLTISGDEIIGDIVIKIKDSNISNNYKITFSYNGNIKEVYLEYGTIGLTDVEPLKSDVEVAGKNYNWDKDLSLYIVKSDDVISAVYTNSSYKINLIGEGCLINNTSATYLTNAEFKLYIIDGYYGTISVSYKIGDSNYTLLEANQDGNYVIDGSLILDDITILVTGLTDIYTLTFIQYNDEISTIQVKYGNTIKSQGLTIPQILDRQSFVAVGYSTNKFDDGTTVNFDLYETNIYENATYYAIYNQINYTIRFGGDGFNLYWKDGESKTIIASGDILTSITNLKLIVELKAGYHKTDEFVVEKIVNNASTYLILTDDYYLVGDVNGSITINIYGVSDVYSAVFTYGDDYKYTSNLYNFKYNTSFNEVLNQAPSVLDCYAKGRTFVGWSLNNDNSVDDFSDSKLTSNITLYACYISNNYTISISSDDLNIYKFASGLTQDSVTYGEDYVINIQLTNGYYIVNNLAFSYSVDGGLTKHNLDGLNLQGDKITDDIILYINKATVSNLYKITFVYGLNKEYTQDCMVAYGSGIKNSQIMQLVNIDGYNTIFDVNVDEFIVTCETTITASYNYAKYNISALDNINVNLSINTISYNTEGSTIVTISFNNGFRLTENTKIYYKVNNLQYNQIAYTLQSDAIQIELLNNNILGDIVIKVDELSDLYTVNYYQSVVDEDTLYLSGDFKLVISKQFRYNQLFKINGFIPEIITGYTFVGYKDQNNQSVTTETKIDNDINVYTNYKINNYTIRYEKSEAYNFVVKTNNDKDIEVVDNGTYYSFNVDYLQTVNIRLVIADGYRAVDQTDLNKLLAVDNLINAHHFDIISNDVVITNLSNEGFTINNVVNDAEVCVFGIINNYLIELYNYVNGEPSLIVSLVTNNQNEYLVNNNEIIELNGYNFNGKWISSLNIEDLAVVQLFVDGDSNNNYYTTLSTAYLNSLKADQKFYAVYQTQLEYININSYNATNYNAFVENIGFDGTIQSNPGFNIISLSNNAVAIDNYSYKLTKNLSFNFSISLNNGYRIVPLRQIVVGYVFSDNFNEYLSTGNGLNVIIAQGGIYSLPSDVLNRSVVIVVNYVSNKYSSTIKINSDESIITINDFKSLYSYNEENYPITINLSDDYFIKVDVYENGSLLQNFKMLYDLTSRDLTSVKVMLNRQKDNDYVVNVTYYKKSILQNSFVGGCYNITNAKQLQVLEFVINNKLSHNYSNANYQLLNDIDMNDVEFNGIGLADFPFEGVFDGSGYKIVGLNIVGEYGALFNYTRSAIITDLTINGTINAKYAGGIVSKALENTAIVNCLVNVNFVNCAYAGGVCAITNGDNINIYNCVTILNINNCTYSAGIIAIARAQSNINYIYSNSVNAIAVNSSNTNYVFTNINNLSTQQLIDQLNIAVNNYNKVLNSWEINLESISICNNWNYTLKQNTYKYLINVQSGTSYIFADGKNYNTLYLITSINGDIVKFYNQQGDEIVVVLQSSQSNPNYKMLITNGMNYISDENVVIDGNAQFINLNKIILFALNPTQSGYTGVVNINNKNTICVSDSENVKIPEDLTTKQFTINYLITNLHKNDSATLIDGIYNINLGTNITLDNAPEFLHSSFSSVMVYNYITNNYDNLDVKSFVFDLDFAYKYADNNGIVTVIYNYSPEFMLEISSNKPTTIEVSKFSNIEGVANITDSISYKLERLSKSNFPITITIKSLSGLKIKHIIMQNDLQTTLLTIDNNKLVITDIQTDTKLIIVYEYVNYNFNFLYYTTNGTPITTINNDVYIYSENQVISSINNETIISKIQNNSSQTDYRFVGYKVLMPTTSGTKYISFSKISNNILLDEEGFPITDESGAMVRLSAEAFAIDGEINILATYVKQFKVVINSNITNSDVDVCKFSVNGMENIVSYSGYVDYGSSLEIKELIINPLYVFNNYLVIGNAKISGNVITDIIDDIDVTINLVPKQVNLTLNADKTTKDFDYQFATTGLMQNDEISAKIGDSITIKFDNTISKQVSKIKLYSANGKLIAETEGNVAIYTLDQQLLEQLKDGYYIQVESTTSVLFISILIVLPLVAIISGAIYVLIIAKISNLKKINKYKDAQNTNFNISQGVDLFIADLKQDNTYDNPNNNKGGND